jgi:hypothetical protein
VALVILPTKVQQVAPVARSWPFLTRSASITLAGLAAWACATPGTGWIRTELYLGRTRADGGIIEQVQLDAFLAREAAPRLVGWTVLDGRGRWTSPDGGGVDEPTSVLVVLHGPGEDSALEAIRRAYARDFGQQSVLRVDTPAAASF